MELEEIVKKLQTASLLPRERRKIQRREWVLRGVLDHNLSMSLLDKIVGKYERIDAVPQGYHQPELYMLKSEGGAD